MKKTKITVIVSLVASVAMLLVILGTSVFAEDEVKAVNNSQATYDIKDDSPAIHVSERNENSVVGVITNVEKWSGSGRSTSSVTYSEGSGVAIAEGGYILTNYHVVSSGDSYQVLMPSGDKVDAELVGYDSSYDLAVLKITDETEAATLTPAAIGTVENMYVGSTVIAIGNPGGETLYNTVTSGIISCLSRNVNGGNTSRTVNYIQHDAAINSGNSGGGLFDVNGNLIGINTLKYGSAYSSTSYEGLGFAIPIDEAYPIAVQLIENGKVRRIGLGVNIKEVSGVDEATETEVPSGLYVQSLVTKGPAEEAGIEVGDFIIAIDGERVKTSEELTSIIDSHSEGDTVKVTVVRYTESDEKDNGGGFTRTSSSGDQYSYGFGGYGGFGGFSDFDDFFNYYYDTPTYDMETIDYDVTLKKLD